MEIWKIAISLKNDFHTAGITKGSTIDVLRDDKHVYIPASHIKGVVRTEAERLRKGLGKDIKIVDILFGPEKQESTGEKGYTEPKLKFLDAAAPVQSLSERQHVKIELETGSSEKGALFTQRTVPMGTVFTSFMFIKGKEGLMPDEKELLDAAFRSAGHYGFGGSRSRGLGGVRIEYNKSSLEELKEALI